MCAEIEPSRLLRVHHREQNQGSSRISKSISAGCRARDASRDEHGTTAFDSRSRDVSCLLLGARRYGTKMPTTN